MAKCPKCNIEIPPYGFPFNGGWNVIICHKCRSKLSIRTSDFYKWYLTPFLALSASGLVVLRYLRVNPIVWGILTTVLSGYFYFTVGWEHTHLEIL